MHESHNLKNPLVKCEGVQTRHTNNQDEQEDTVDTVQTVCSNVTGPEIRLCNVLLAAVQKAAWLAGPSVCHEEHSCRQTQRGRSVRYGGERGQTLQSWGPAIRFAGPLWALINTSTACRARAKTETEKKRRTKNSWLELCYLRMTRNLKELLAKIISVFTHPHVVQNL